MNGIERVKCGVCGRGTLVAHVLNGSVLWLVCMNDKCGAQFPASTVEKYALVNGETP